MCDLGDKLSVRACVRVCVDVCACVVGKVYIRTHSNQVKYALHFETEHRKMK